MSESNFENVTVEKLANVYFDGKVTSRTIYLPDGAKKTLGVMLEGDYEFGTGDRELMEITSGDVDVLLPGSDEWQKITSDMSFAVPASSKFKIKVNSITNYCCSYFSD